MPMRYWLFYLKNINKNRINKPKFVIIKIGDTDLDEEDETSKLYHLLDEQGI